VPLWIKLHDDFHNHHRLTDCAKALGVHKDHLGMMLLRFWSWARDSSLDGRVGTSADALAAAMQWSDCAPVQLFPDGQPVRDNFGQFVRMPPSTLMMALVRHGWLSIDGGQFIIPKWNAHQGAFVEARTLATARKTKQRSNDNKRKNQKRTWAAKNRRKTAKVVHLAFVPPAP
jgi:hypothetical protein